MYRSSMTSWKYGETLREEETDRRESTGALPGEAINRGQTDAH